MKNSIIKNVIKKEFVVLKAQKLKTQTILFSLFVLVLVSGMFFMMAFLLNSNKVTLDFEPDEQLHKIINQNGKRVSVAYDYREAMDLLDEFSINYFVTKKNNQFYIYYNDMLCNQKMLDGVTKILTDYCEQESIDCEIKTVSRIIDGSESYGTMKKQPVSIAAGMILIITISISTLAAINMIATEKEKGTLETMFTFPIKRKQVISGKLYTSCIIALSISAVMVVVCFILTRLLMGFLDIYETTGMPSIIDVLLLLASLITFAFLISSYGIWKSLKAKSAMMAEAKMMILNLILFVAMLASLGIEGTSLTTSLIPMVNELFIILSVFTQGFSKMYCIISIIFNLVITWVILEKINDITESDKVLFE